MDWQIDDIVPPSAIISETNDTSVTILPTYRTARVRLASYVTAREKKDMVSSPYTRP